MTCAVCVTDYSSENSFGECNCIEEIHANLSNGGVSKIAEIKLQDFATGEATNIKALDGKPYFTIVGVESSDYEDQDGVHQGIRIKTKESFESFNQFYTTRTVIVSKFYNKEKVPTALATAIIAGGELKVKSVSKKSKSGREYYDFEQA